MAITEAVGLFSIDLVGHSASSTLSFRTPLIRDLIVAGAHVRVLAPDWTSVQLAELDALGAKGLGYPLARTGLNPLQDVLTLWHLWRHFCRTQPDVVFTYAAKPNVWGTLAAAWAGVPRRVAMVEGLGYAFTAAGQGRWVPKQRFLKAVLAVLYRLAFRCAHKVVVLNPDDARDLERWCGLPSEKTVLLGGIGVPLDEWPSAPAHIEPVTFTLVARMLREKGVLEFLHAAERVKKHHPKVRFILLGGLDSNPGGVSAADLHPWVERGIVDWPGQVDVKPWLKQTSVFVLPSYREGVPRSTQEAMAMARPVITTDVPGCRDTVVDGVNGFMIPPQDVGALVQAMERFIVEPELIARMGAESRRLAEERFDVRMINRKLIAAMGLA